MNLKRLKKMTLLLYNVKLKKCTVKQINKATECMLIEDDDIHNEIYIQNYQNYII